MAQELTFSSISIEECKKLSESERNRLWAIEFPETAAGCGGWAGACAHCPYNCWGEKT